MFIAYNHFKISLFFRNIDRQDKNKEICKFFATNQAILKLSYTCSCKSAAHGVIMETDTLYSAVTQGRGSACLLMDTTTLLAHIDGQSRKQKEGWDEFLRGVRIIKSGCLCVQSGGPYLML